MAGFSIEPLLEADQEKYEEEYEKYLADQGLPDPHGPVSPVHKNLEKLRQDRNLKKNKMAEIMGVTTRTYYAYEKGERSVPSDALVRLATELNIDLHIVLMGKTASTEFQVIRSAFQDLGFIDKHLIKEYPQMDTATRLEVVRHCLEADWEGWPRTHPEIIRAAVSELKRYKFEPYEVPPPPDERQYGEDQLGQYKQNLSDWHSVVDVELEKQKVDRFE